MTQPLDSNRSTIEAFDKTQIIQELMETTAKLQTKFQEEDDEEKQWLVANSSNPEVLSFLQESTVMMLHVIDAIGGLEPVNGITISKQFGIPKGSVSKITRRLVEKKIIRTEYLPGNKKEVLFCTTSLGKEIFDLHQALHRQIDKGVHRFLQRYSEDELKFIMQCLQDVLEASWVQVESEEEEALPESSQVMAQEQQVSQATEDRDDIMKMMKSLSGPELKKAKAILKDVFFTSYDE
ncbi:helix-turn-helix domain-containing protein [Paenibacillus guangzhouensis]|uniref:MarR family transcriptional regulator n=1 Tax=Paenibacillus guangzhouensis TaxID=1473112 RepID=UPI00126782A8|nr:MarR family transcriptional regulator [Paenibacillus guangzhouensis]